MPLTDVALVRKLFLMPCRLIASSLACTGAIKGGSGSHTMRALVEAFDASDLKFPCIYWIDRVPSYSNVADGPSRGDSSEALELMHCGRASAFETLASLKDMLVTQRRRKGE